MRILSSPSEAYPSRQFVEKTPDFPKRMRIIPSDSPANRPDPVQGFPFVPDLHLALVFITPKHGYFHHLGNTFSDRSARIGIGPARNHSFAIYTVECQSHCLIISQQLNSQSFMQPVLAGNHLHFHIVHKVDRQLV